MIALRYIDVRRHNNYAMQAALHGHKIKLKGVTPQVQEKGFSDEESAAADRAMKKAMMRMKFKK